MSCLQPLWKKGYAEVWLMVNQEGDSVLEPSGAVEVNQATDAH